MWLYCDKCSIVKVRDIVFLDKCDTAGMSNQSQIVHALATTTLTQFECPKTMVEALPGKNAEMWRLAREYQISKLTIFY